MTRLPITCALSINQRITLDDDLRHYVRTVLRLNEGAEVVLFNGDGRDYHAVVTVGSKKNVELDITGCVENTTESPLDVTLLQGVAKGERMDFVMQKATELGVTKIIPVVTEFCAVKQTSNYRTKKPLHWQNIVNFAAAQSGRARMPEVTEPMLLADALTRLTDDTFDTKWALSLTGQRASTRLQGESSDVKRICVLIGPEGGLSEKDLMFANEHGFDEVKLGSRVLRTETAALTVLATLQAHLGDF